MKYKIIKSIKRLLGKEKFMDRVNRIINKEIVPLFIEYNKYAIPFTSPKYFSFRESSITNKLHNNNVGFALRDLIFEFSKGEFKINEIVSRKVIPRDELNFCKTDEDIKNYLLPLYLNLFSDIKNESNIQPGSYFLGNDYFNIERMGYSGKYIAQLSNTLGDYEIRAYHYSYKFVESK